MAWHVVIAGAGFQGASTPRCDGSELGRLGHPGRLVDTTSGGLPAEVPASDGAARAAAR
jgi:hypothetical protein